MVAEREHLPGKPAPDTFLAGARALGVAPADAAVFEDALAGVEAGRAGGFGCVVGVDRAGQADALRAHGADVVVTDLAELLEHARDRSTPPSPVEPWACARPSSTSTCSTQSESVFALSNGHIGLRGNLDEGEPHGLPGTYLNGFYELRPLPYAEAGYGYPEAGQTVINVTNGKIIRLLVDDEPFDVRYGELRTPRARARPARRRAAPPRRVALAGRASGCASARCGWSRSPSARWPPIGYEVEPLDAPARRRRPVRAGRQRADADGARGDPRAAAALERAAALPSSSRRTTTRVVLVHRTEPAGCGWPPPWTTWSTGPPGTATATESSERPRPGDGHRRRSSRASGCGW